ncbi:MAG: DUF2867 domain-containing protein [Hyphomicrobiaceae bacterium]|nr:DUF2867 domain-containing protein [Hyphomicrobiaceae bacterium]
MNEAVAVPVPVASSLHEASQRADFADCYEIALTRTDLDAEALYRAVLAGGMPGWVEPLMRLRNKLAPLFGARPVEPFDLAAEAKAMSGKPAGPFRFYSRNADEVVAGDDDRHLDFRLGLLKAVRDGVARLTLTTVVTFRNRRGRLYLLMVLPFHKLIVRTSLRNAARNGLI